MRSSPGENPQYSVIFSVGGGSEEKLGERMLRERDRESTFCAEELGGGSSRTWWVGKLIPAEAGQANPSEETVTAALPDLPFTTSILPSPAHVNNNSNFNQENNILSSEERNCRSGGGSVICTEC